MKLCYNSLLLIINNFYSSEITLTDLNDMLFRSIDENFGRTKIDEPIEYRQGYASELKRGKIDIPKDMKLAAKRQTYKQILEGVRKHCKLLLKQSNNIVLMGLINQLVIQSSNIDVNDVIFEEPTIKKLHFSMVKISFDEYLARILRYIFVNAIAINKVKKTGFDPFHAFTDENYNSLLEDTKKIISPTIETTSLLTIEGLDDFNNTFHEIAHPANLSSKKPNDIKLYYLNTDSDGLNYELLKDFVLLNLGNYIYSRQESQQHIDSGKIKLIALNAINEFKKSNVFNGDELGNILLYSFLECILKAPKLFSNYEINKHSISSSNAIHLCTIQDEKTPYSMLVFGTSNIEEDFSIAFTNTINKIVSIKKDEENKFNFVNSSIFNASFDLVNAEKIKSLIIPNEIKTSYIQSGYAIFIGYKVNVDPNSYDTPEEFSNALKEEMKQDIINNLELIENTIVNNKLDKRSIYIYVLPFNNPTNDKSSIIEEIGN